MIKLIIMALNVISINGIKIGHVNFASTVWMVQIQMAEDLPELPMQSYLQAYTSSKARRHIKW